MSHLGDLKSVLSVAMKSPFYQKKYKNIDDMQSIPLKKIPFLTKKELLSGIQKLLTVPPNKADYIYCSSGSSNKPKTFYYSIEDLSRITKLCARFSRMEGVNANDTVMILLPMRLWAAGPITQYGHSRNNATVIPLDLTGTLKTKASIFNLLEPTVLSSTPSILLDFIKQNITPKVKLIETTGEPLIPKTRQKIERFFDAEVFDAYGLAECVIGTECSIHDGFHYWPDSVMIEIIDPETGENLPNGEVGEIVVTNLIQETMPIIRYRTGDLGYISVDPCKCGRKVPRVWVKGRLKETIFLPGAVKVHQFQILNVLAQFPKLSPNYQVIISKKHEKTNLLFRIEGETDVNLSKLRKAISELSIDFYDLINNDLVQIEIEILEPKSLERSPVSNKILNKIVDKRNLY